MAEYGDADGTKTSKAKSTAENKLMKYYTLLGKALGMKNVRKWWVMIELTVILELLELI